MSMSVSVIIPALNEAGCIADTVRSIRVQLPEEIIVVDGGSQDGTREMAAQADLVLTSPPGRAVQMNVGAARARGEYLLFLHADCTLEEGALASIRGCLNRKGRIAGCFSMRVQAEGFLYRCIDWCATARTRLAGMVYGDQGLFLRRADFERLGGFPPVGFMEDVFFSQVLRRQGGIAVVPEKIRVAPRRWQKTGLLRQTLGNWALTTLAAAGVPPDRLAGYYPRVR